MNLNRLYSMKNANNSKWQDRIIAELEYAYQLYESQEGLNPGVIGAAVDFLLDEQAREGVLSDSACRKAEEMILPFSPIAKECEVICVAHAHIDMNWLWDFSETVCITLDTFRTMLDLMEEYPDFTFSQSQASCYKIAQTYDKKLFERIKKRISEGRWEVTASTWVETDKNMPSGESLSRHIDYTKRYFHDNMGIEYDDLTIDFEPDTFGHNENVPEILTQGGVKYYYFCRGYEGHSIFRWRSPSGSEVLAYREPFWYGGIPVKSDFVMYMPSYCKEYGVTTCMKVYGVGDHGGGPSRRDIERLKDMMSWPVYPQLRFGTYREYFSYLNKIRDTFPVYTKELNAVFTGCYTTHNRIKAANKLSENRLVAAETSMAAASLLAGTEADEQLIGEAWKKTLFNHFHDIITGSGVHATLEYAMGEYQKVLACANTQIVEAMREISALIDTSALSDSGYGNNARETISEGGGVGFDIASGVLTGPERCAGSTRIYTVFNFSQYERKEIVKLTVWDWDYNERSAEVLNADGIPVQIEVCPVRYPSHINPKRQHYQGHDFIDILISVDIPAYSYQVYTLREADRKYVDIPVFPLPRLHTPVDYILKNDKITAVFDSKGFSLVSLIDEHGREHIRPEKCGRFRLIDERDVGETAWIVGRYMRCEDLLDDATLIEFHTGAVSSRLEYCVRFRQTNMHVKITLNQGSDVLIYEVNCDWREFAKPGVSVPQLQFIVPLNESADEYRYNVPCGIISREPVEQDMPGSGFICGGNTMLMCNARYGFRGHNNDISVTLIRGSRDPDPIPEAGNTAFKIAVSPVSASDYIQMTQKAYRFENPLSYVSVKPHKGTEPLQKRFFDISGNVTVVNIQRNREEDALLVRLNEIARKDAEVVFRFDRPVRKASFVKLNGQLISALPLAAPSNELKVSIPAASLRTVKIVF